MPKIFSIMKFRTLYLKKLYFRFGKFLRQFKFNLRCMGRVTLIELARFTFSVNLSAFRLFFIR